VHKVLTVISGNLGSGKTLLLTIIGKLAQTKLISNFNLEFEHEKFDLVKFVKAEYDNAIILIDEAYTLLESRSSMSNLNKALSYILFQSRKKSIDMYLTVQLNSTLDLRFRQLSDYFIFAHGLIKYRGKFAYKYTLQCKESQKSCYIDYEIAKKYYELYDTNQIIEPVNREDLIKSLKTPKQKVEECKQIAKELCKKSKKITKNSVKTYLFEHTYPKQYLDYVYTYSKQIKDGIDIFGTV